MITPEVAESIRTSVLAWLATVSADGIPNVSPKEAFLYDGAGKVLVAHIASPVTVRNLRANPGVCLSFVDVFVQKGYKITGRARVLKRGEDGFTRGHDLLVALVGDAYPIAAVIEIEPVAVAAITAPSYHLFPQTGEEERIREALESYRVAGYQERVRQREGGPPV